MLLHVMFDNKLGHNISQPDNALDPHALVLVFSATLLSTSYLSAKTYTLNYKKFNFIILSSIMT